jgi:hypothetical protein
MTITNEQFPARGNFLIEDFSSKDPQVPSSKMFFMSKFLSLWTSRLQTYRHHSRVKFPKASTPKISMNKSKLR